ncbi:MAG: transketolase [FCB group bacterium]|jgi:transketolase|nr:transketolase [FCB group bacterium]
MNLNELGRKKVTVDEQLVRRLANTIRGLSIDATNAADSGHPGLPLGAADFAVTLWYYFLRFNPEDPKWPGRDKFILSGGHGSMLIYSLLHLAGYDLTMEELKNFRQWNSKTPGHPESHITRGVETTTGPLGQGFANGVGFGLADAMLAARVNREGFTPIDSFTYVLTTDGDLMEGVALEAASFAGHLKLGNLIYLYDDNSISLDGPTSLIFDTEDTPAKFAAMGWHVQTVDGHNPQEVADAIYAAQKETTKPSLICCKTIIGYGSPNKAGTSGAHGSPLGEEEGNKTKEALGIPLQKFHVPQEDRDAWGARIDEMKCLYREWKQHVDQARKDHSDCVRILEGSFKQELPANLEKVLPAFSPEKPVATRKAGAAVLKELGKHVPWLVGGSADLSVSTNAIVSDEKVLAGSYKGRHIFFGVREHGMGGIVNGMVQHGAFRAFGATFLTFSDYMRGSVRLSALMQCPSIWVYTHDSIFLGEDGPTHQPVEHVTALRAIPGLLVFRPADAIETGLSWVAALQEKHLPSAIILSRQNLPVYDREAKEFCGGKGDFFKGGYVFRPEKDPKKLDGILIGTGSELQLCIEAARRMEAEGKSIRVVSMPCRELFDRQDGSYKNAILPELCEARVAVEAGISMGWERYVGARGRTVSQDTFGQSAPDKVLAGEFGFTPEKVIARMLESM